MHDYPIPTYCLCYPYSVDDLKHIGDYDIIEEVGAGGMGLVYKAVHRKLGRTVALKVVRGRYADSSQHIDRFKREAAVCSRLKHPNVVELYDFGEEEGAIFYAMQFVDAPTLDQILEGEGALQPKRFYPIFNQLANALVYIHEQGLVHRDIKPSNVMVASSGHVTLMDFGLVKQDEGTVLTQEGKAIGTPRYMSPEMLQAHGVDHRSDIFQFGLLLFEAATNKRPFKGRDVYAIAAAVLSQSPSKPSSIVKRLKRNFDTLVLNCLEKEPNNRYQNANDLLADLERCRKNIPIACTNLINTDETEAEMDAVETSDSGKTVSLTVVSGVGLSSISGSVSRLQDLGLRHLLLGVFAAVVLVSAAFSFLSSPPVNYTSLDVKVLHDVGGATLEWKSQIPYQSHVRYWRRDSENIGQALSVKVDRETKTHSIYVPSLDYGRAYAFVIDYPSGKSSMEYLIEPLKYRQLRLLNHKLLPTTLTCAKLQLESNLPCRTTVEFRNGGKKRREADSDILLKKHVMLIENIEAGKPLRDIVVTLESNKSSNMVQIGTFGGLEHIVSQAKELQKGTKLEEFLPQIEKIYKSDLNEQQRAEAKAQLRNILKPIHSWHEFLARRELYKDIFKQKAPSYASYHNRLYSIIRHFEHIDAQLNQVKAGFDYSVNNVYSSFISISHSRVRRSGQNVKIFALKEKESTFTPAEQYHQSKAASGLFQLYRSHEEFQARKELVVELDLNSFLADCSDRPSLIARVRNFEPAYYMRVIINGKHYVDLRNTQKSLPPVLFLFDRRVRDVEDEMYKKSMNFISASFPRHFLRPGMNKFRIVLHVIPGFKTMNMLQLRELRMFGD